MENYLLFKSHHDFSNFKKEVKSKQRFIRSDVTETFLRTLKMSLPNRELRLNTDYSLYRSQIGCDEFESQGEKGIRPFPPERMKPLPHLVREGRANPKGIAYLYLSNDMDTSRAELRPHVGQIISSAQFMPQRNLKVINCYSTEKKYNEAQLILCPPNTQEDITCAIWGKINEAFTKPITNKESNSEYVPTQILAELFKSEGYDGICYKSFLGSGYNFTLFDLNSVSFHNCIFTKTAKINYMFKNFFDPYIAKKPT